MTKKISLKQALTGVDFLVNHVDVSQIRVKNQAGDVIKPQMIKTVLEKGLPFHRKSYEFGNLFIQFEIQFPDKLNARQILEAQAALDSMDVEMTNESKIFPLEKFCDE